MTESFYDILGVSADADSDEIERAYRQRVKETHPDLNDDPDASERTASIVEAKDVLTDPDERARYDRIGHEAYVNDDSPTGAGDPYQSNPGAAAAAARSGSRSSESTNARASAEERRRRERRARQDVNFGTESTGAEPADSATSTTDSNRTRRSSTGTNVPPSWSDTSDGWAARDPTDPPPGLATQTVEAVIEAPATAGVTFLLYPLLVLGTFFPPFPLAVNVIVGACLLAMIGASQSVAGLGVAIYGSWSVLGSILLIWMGQNPISPLGAIVLGTTWLPLGFSLLTYLVLDA